MYIYIYIYIYIMTYIERVAPRSCEPYSTIYTVHDEEAPDHEHDLRRHPSSERADQSNARQTGKRQLHNQRRVR